MGNILDINSFLSGDDIENVHDGVNQFTYVTAAGDYTDP